MTPPAAAASTAPAVHPRRAPLTPARRPRRVSGPGARPARARSSRPAPVVRPVRPSPATAASAARARSLLDSRAIDSLIHGRAWIAIVTFALIGIVTMQLGLLKLNAGIGRALVHEAALQRENSALSVENSEAAAANTIEQQAAHMGMRLIPLGALRFLSAQVSRADLGRALQRLNEPVSAPTSSYATTAGTAEAASTFASEPAIAPSESAVAPSEPAIAPAEAAAGTTAVEVAAPASTEPPAGATGAEAGAVSASEVTAGATSAALAPATGSAAAPEGPQG